MIFVTVGTHEQGFERLIKEIDDLKQAKVIQEEVIIQKGYTKYNPTSCKSYELIDYNRLQQYLQEARIIITHGGPSSFMSVLSIGKIPIVVPRQMEFEEHVNNHQVDFVKQVALRFNNIIPIYDIKELKEKIINYDDIVNNMAQNYKTNNKEFVRKLESEIKQLFL